MLYDVGRNTCYFSAENQGAGRRLDEQFIFSDMRMLCLSAA